jgi:hypothetical protein
VSSIKEGRCIVSTQGTLRYIRAESAALYLHEGVDAISISITVISQHRRQSAISYFSIFFWVSQKATVIAEGGITVNRFGQFK